MDFGFSEQQVTLQREAKEFAAQNLGTDLVSRDRRGAIDERDWRKDWEKCAEFGALSMLVPERYGGKGYSILDTILVLEAIGYGCRDNGLTLSLNGQIWAVQEPILTFGNEDQKRKYLPGLCDGSVVGAHAMTEPQSGSDAFALQTSAREVDGGYLLNGVKTLVGMAPACDLALVFASTSPAQGRWGISMFVVEASRSGFLRDSQQEKMGTRTAPMGTIELINCWVPSENRIGPVGAGASMFQDTMEWERSFIFAGHLGAMARQLDDCVTFAQKREVFGDTIDSFQSVSNRLAEMKLRLETAQLLLYKAAWLKDQGNPTALHAALTKLHLSEAFVASSLDAIRVHGGRGYLTEAGIERDLRDAVGGIIYSGTSDIQRQLISTLLKL